MSETSRPSGQRARAPATWLDPGRLLLVALFALAAILYLQRAFQWFMYDDEGSYAYAAWRISLGEVPYRDFLTPQMPLFLYWGGLLVRLFGRSYVALRLPSMAATLFSACLLYRVNRELFSRPVALASMALFMVDTNVFHNARFYRPEAYMVLFDLAGLYCIVLAQKRGRLRYLSLGGLFFGLSIASKLFAALSLAGAYLYLLYSGGRERRPPSLVIRQGLALGLPAALVAGVIGAIFYHLTPYFLVAIFEHHMMQGAGMPVWGRVAKGLEFFGAWAWHQPVLVGLIAWGVLSLRRRDALVTLLAWQLPTALSFFALTRSLMTRHLTYLAPAMATLAALALVGLMDGHWRIPRLARRWQYQLLALALAGLALWRGTKLSIIDGNMRDPEPYRMATLIQELTSPDDVVISDFPGINFAAGRPSTYWAAGISGGAAESGQVRGEALIQEIERSHVAMVLINTKWGAHQMTEMVDYPLFRSYVQSHFALIDKYQCAFQQFEIYARTDTMPYRPGVSFGGQLLLTGVRLDHTELSAGSKLALDTRWQALAAMPKRFTVSLRLVDATGRLWAQVDGPLLEEFSHIEPGLLNDVIERYPTTDWVPQQVVFQSHRMPVPRTVPAGTYYLTAEVYDLASGYTLAERAARGARLAGGDAVIATVKVTSSQAPDLTALGLAGKLGNSPAPGLLAFTGVVPQPTSEEAGRSLGLSLFWQASGAPPQDYRLEIRLTGNGHIRARWPQEVVPGFATSTWRDGEVYLASYTLPLPGDLADGGYGLEAQVLDNRGQPVGQPLPLVTNVRIWSQPDPATVERTITHRLEGISFADGIGLLGYDVSSEGLKPGEALGLTLYWKCLQPPAKDYKVFTHLLDSASQVQGQSDDMPDSGQAPTSTWVVGDVLVDRYEIPLASAAAPGTLQVEIGFYDPLTGQRLAVLHDGQLSTEDRLILPITITVR